MPTFTAITLDRLLEQGASKSAADSKLDHRKFTPARANGTPVEDSRAVSIPNRKPSAPVPPPHPNLTRRNSFSSESTAPAEKRAQFPQISPALYATPASTPLPDSPTSFPPSPYVINHKRRGPRLQKSSSEASVLKEKAVDKKFPSSIHLSDAEIESQFSSAVADVVTESNYVEEETVNGFNEEKIGSGVVLEVTREPNDVEKGTEIDDFFDPQESMSIASNTDVEDICADQSARTITATGVFYDAWEELSSESGRQPESSTRDLEAELREIRLSLLMEIEKRKQAEDDLNNMQSQYQILRERLREVGLVLPTDLSSIAQDAQMNFDSIEDVCQQVHVTQFVSESIGRGAARAECEEEMEAQLESKNFEIARLCDRLRYYETVNQEMSQRNQEAIELARRDRQKRRMMRKYVWGSIIAAITLGSAALAWSYFPNGKGSLSSHQLHAAEPDTGAE